MSCYSPLKGFQTAAGVVFSELRRHGQILREVEVPCGQCIGCRARRASDWAARVMHEASLHDFNSFLTLTYGRDCLPAGGSLDYRDFQLFMKRLRKRFGNVRFYMCGEYGPQTMRPHYHACIFGVDFRDDRVPAGKSSSGHLFYESEVLDSLWTHGKCTVQDLTKETALYCAKYIISKLTGDAAQVYGDKVPPFARMSLKPGIGARWLEMYRKDVYSYDYVIQDGKEVRTPKYYDRLVKRADTVDMVQLADDREVRAFKSRADNTSERRKVREQCHLEKARVFARKDL